jgi:hypothetical protein
MGKIKVGQSPVCRGDAGGTNYFCGFYDLLLRLFSKLFEFYLVFIG